MIHCENCLGCGFLYIDDYIQGSGSPITFTQYFPSDFILLILYYAEDIQWTLSLPVNCIGFCKQIFFSNHSLYQSNQKSKKVCSMHLACSFKIIEYNSMYDSFSAGSDVVVLYLSLLLSLLSEE